jgi:hypothetical protein
MNDRDLIARLATALRAQLDGVNLYSELLAEADAHQGKPGGGAMSGLAIWKTAAFTAVFGCGGVVFMNLERLVPGFGDGYSASWFKVFLSLLVVVRLFFFLVHREEIR